ncbi:MAG: cation diffusion facilitator family transporter [Desulfuromonadales bacterium]|nr:cation diffusion facilitator family transporter [Desulfuromonadales bacterium]
MSTSPKKSAAYLSVVAAISLAAIKLLIGLATGSLAVLASAVDSLLDILMSSINFFAIQRAEQPADECHPFGHGKYETLAAFIQALIIAASGLWIIFESIRRLFGEIELRRIDTGIAVLAFSAVCSWLIARHLRKVARATDSPALETDSLHFAMDVYTNLALLIGLVVVNVFNVPQLDPILSLGVALYILFEALQLVRRSLNDVLDAELPKEHREHIEQLLNEHRADIINYHNLRTRQAGSQKIMDFHLTVCRHLTVEQAHDIADQLEQKIEKDILGADVTIHMEPCKREDCPGRDVCIPERMKNHQAL